MGKLLCGIESPIRPNDEFFVLDEQSDQIVRQDRTVEGVYRYSFVEEDGVAHRLGRLLEVADWLLNGACPRFSVFSWCNSQAESGRVRLRAVLSRLQQTSWAAAVRDDLGTAIRPLELPLNHQLNPPNLDLAKTNGGVVVMCGMSLSPDVLLAPPCCQTMAMLGKTRTFVPSYEFLNWMSRSRLQLLYRRNPPHADRNGLVFLSTIPLSQSELARSGLVDEIKDGDAAISIWQTK